jgi:hypothetical protein
MEERIEILSRRDADWQTSFGALASSSAPDATFFTTCAPSSSQVSYIPFGALAANIGGAQPFSYALLLRMGSFGSWTSNPNSWTTSQRVLTLSDGKNGGSIYVWSGPQGFSLSLGYMNGFFQYTGRAEWNEWMHLAFTWDGTTATSYLNGMALSLALSNKDVLSKPTFTIGLNATDPPAKPSQGVTSGPFIGDVKSFYVWNVCLSAADVQQQMWKTASSPLYLSSLLLGYDFTANPPKKIGSGPTASPKNTLARGNAASLGSWGRDVAKAGQGTNINPGGTAPFSVLAWIFVGNPASVTPNLNGYIFSNGAVDASAHMGLKLVDGALTAEIGSTTVSSSTKLSGYQWYYVALTYDGANGTLYVNSAPAGTGRLSGDSPLQGAPVLFGALDTTGAPVGCLQGYIQFLSVWKSCLNASQVERQADEDPTLEPDCVANFMCSTEPCVDSLAAHTSGLWSANQLQRGQGVFFGTTYLFNTGGAQGVAKPLPQPGTSRRARVRLDSFGGSGPLRPAAVEPFSAAHKQLMLDEFTTAASSMVDSALVERWTAAFADELDQVFNQARTSPDSIAHPYVSYELINGEYRLFYHPDAKQKIDLGVSVDISLECAAWWASFILTTFLGVFEIFGIPTPVDDLTNLAKRIVTDPVVIQTCTSAIGFTFTAASVLSFCKVLYDFGYLSQAFWLVARSIGWWTAGKLLVYFVGCLLPVPSPQKALLIANMIKLVAQLTVQRGGYARACGQGGCCGETKMLPVA